MRLQEIEQDKYEEIWSIDDYAKDSPGELVSSAFAKIALSGSVLDAGCGSGKGAKALQRLGFNVSMCDFVETGLIEDIENIPFFKSCLWEPIIFGKFDWIYCCDVLEHIPTEFTMLAIYHLLEASKKGLFCSITFVPDNFGPFIGKSLHLTVQSFLWWKDHFNELGRVVESRDLLESGLFVVERK